MASDTVGDDLRIVQLDARDLRWPTSMGGHGSDAMHTDPDYSCVYVTLTTERGVSGHGLTFTLGRGNEIVLMAVKTMASLVRDRNAGEIFRQFGAFWRELTSESQLRWVSAFKVRSLYMNIKFFFKTHIVGTGKGSDAFGGGGHHKRFVGLVGATGG